MYKGKGGYSAEGLEQRVTYIIRNMFMNYRVKKIAKIYPHEKQLFFLPLSLKSQRLVVFQFIFRF